MVDTQLLDEKIKSSGIKTSFIIQQLGISANGFYKKKNGEIPFRVAEMYVIKDILRLSDIDSEKIFYS